MCQSKSLHPAIKPAYILLFACNCGELIKEILLVTGGARTSATSHLADFESDFGGFAQGCTAEQRRA